ncbi:DNA ligase [Alcanivorax sp. N3-2A]|nr:DNA ligase [Alcanivorax sp. N3-2A]|tara:strand:+ start:1157 stop:2026 length:870 start_codon:yes stop_codon:yes gene_type:complete
MSRPIAYFVAASLVMFTTVVATVGQGRSVPALMLANVYDHQGDLRDYWVSEKLDGVRAYWNGDRLLSRNGNVFEAPPWFTSGFPNQPLDGELWMGRGTFATLSGAVRRDKPDPRQWRRIRFMAFDMPRAPGSFDQRLARLKTLLASNQNPYIQAVEQFKIEDQAALMSRLRKVLASGGEGLMLHRADAAYHGYRSDDLLKLKPYQDDDARVVAYLPGNGKYTGMLGALVVADDNGRQFRIGTGFSDKERARPPPVGSVITYQYRGRTSSGLPRFPSFLRIRRPAGSVDQ